MTRFSFFRDWWIYCLVLPVVWAVAIGLVVCLWYDLNILVPVGDALFGGIFFQVWGPSRGGCGHRHKSYRTATTCLRRDGTTVEFVMQHGVRGNPILQACETEDGRVLWYENDFRRSPCVRLGIRDRLLPCIDCGHATVRARDGQRLCEACYQAYREACAGKVPSRAMSYWQGPPIR